MNYRHAFHAGNHADVFKHIILTRLIALLSRKEAPFVYLDTHAGVGIYDVHGNEASRTGEWLEGIDVLMKCPEPSDLLKDYMHVIHQLNSLHDFRYYPGSPMIAQCLLRSQDRLILNEKHTDDGALLKSNFQHDPRVSIHQRDGWLLPNALLPVPEKRALVLIDPPFEQAHEWLSCVNTMKQAIKKMRQAIVVVWYPIKDRKQLNHFYLQMKDSGVPTLLKAEFMVNQADNSLGLNGSGLLIANPPWGLLHELSSLLPFLVHSISSGKGRWSLDWLIEEASKT